MIRNILISNERRPTSVLPAHKFVQTADDSLQMRLLFVIVELCDGLLADRGLTEGSDSLTFAFRLMSGVIFSLLKQAALFTDGSAPPASVPGYFCAVFICLLPRFRLADVCLFFLASCLNP